MIRVGLLTLLFLIASCASITPQPVREPVVIVKAITPSAMPNYEKSGPVACYLGANGHSLKVNRSQCMIRLKNEAGKLGATAVVIESVRSLSKSKETGLDCYNCIEMSGTAYRKKAKPKPSP